MATKNINARIMQKIDTAANWNSKNIILLLGEIGIESDTNLLKIGDGKTTWKNLPYINSSNAKQLNSIIATTASELKYFEEAGMPIIFDAQ